MHTSPSPNRLTFGIRGMMLVVLLIAVGLASYSYRSKALRPDLSISASDVAWATDVKIWKFDLTDAGEIYGLQIVVFENGGTTKRKIVGIGDGTRLDTVKYPLVMACAKSCNGGIEGKLGCFGSSVTFEIENLFNGKGVSSMGQPVLNKDIYYLMSDSEGLPFSKTSNKFALELIRTNNLP